MAAELKQCRSISKVFGENVRRYRELAHISRFQFKAEAMLDDRQIRDIENGTHNPTLLTMERIADTLCIPLSELLSAPLNILPFRFPHTSRGLTDSPHPCSRFFFPSGAIL